MKTNVQITASKKEFMNGIKGYEVRVEGMEGKLQCKMNFTDPLKAMRYMFLLSKRLELQVDNIQLAALSLAYQRAKEAVDKVVEDTAKAADDVAAETERKSEQPAQAPQDVVEQPELFKEEQPAPSLLKQFDELKTKHPNALLLFRCGDFYESYREDAKKCADTLGITLTKRSGDSLEMAGFPHHALDTYLPKLIRAGHRVAICDDITEPKAKTRKKTIAEMVTPMGVEKTEGAA